MKKGYTNKEVTKILNLTARVVQSYSDQGIVIPDIYNPAGRGSTRIYSRKNLVEFLIVRKLAEHGVTLAKIKDILTRAKRSGRYAEPWWDPENEIYKNRKMYLIILYPIDAEGEIEVHLNDSPIGEMTEKYGDILTIDLTLLVKKIADI